MKSLGMIDFVTYPTPPIYVKHEPKPLTSCDYHYIAEHTLTNNGCSHLFERFQTGSYGADNQND